MTISTDMITCPKCGNRSPSWAATCEKCGTHLSLAQSDSSLKHRVVQQEVRSAPPQKLPMIAHILCGWPLILLFIGGAIGGALGGVAYAVNISLYKSNLPGVLKFMLNLLIGMLAIGIWLTISAMLIRR
jgi:hypothetical protein